MDSLCEYHKVQIRPVFSNLQLNTEHNGHRRPFANAKMNLMTISPDARTLFVASGSKVLAYSLSSRGEPSIKPQYIDLEEPATINQIRTGYCRHEPVLQIVDDGGKMTIFFLDDSLKRPFTLSNIQPSVEDNTTWSLGCSPGRTLVAAGSNSHNLTVWDLSIHALSSSERKMIICGHQDNVPCLSFSPDGTLVASASIDASVAIWDALRGRLLLRKVIDEHSRGWAVRWVPFASLKQINNTEEKVLQRENQQQPHQQSEYDAVFAFLDSIRPPHTLTELQQFLLHHAFGSTRTPGAAGGSQGGEEEEEAEGDDEHDEYDDLEEGEEDEEDGQEEGRRELDESGNYEDADEYIENDEDEDDDQQDQHQHQHDQIADQDQALEHDSSSDNSSINAMTVLPIASSSSSSTRSTTTNATTRTTTTAIQRRRNMRLLSRRRPHRSSTSNSDSDYSAPSSPTHGSGHGRRTDPSNNRTGSTAGLRYQPVAFGASDNELSDGDTMRTPPITFSPSLSSPLPAIPSSPLHVSSPTTAAIRVSSTRVVVPSSSLLAASPASSPASSGSSGTGIAPPPVSLTAPAFGREGYPAGSVSMVSLVPVPPPAVIIPPAPAAMQISPATAFPAPPTAFVTASASASPVRSAPISISLRAYQSPTSSPMTMPLSGPSPVRTPPASATLSSPPSSGAGFSLVNFTSGIRPAPFSLSPISSPSRHPQPEPEVLEMEHDLELLSQHSAASSPVQSPSRTSRTRHRFNSNAGSATSGSGSTTGSHHNHHPSHHPRSPHHLSPSVSPSRPTLPPNWSSQSTRSNTGSTPLTGSPATQRPLPHPLPDTDFLLSPLSPRSPMSQPMSPHSLSHSLSPMPSSPLSHIHPHSHRRRVGSIDSDIGTGSTGATSGIASMSTFASSTFPRASIGPPTASGSVATATHSVVAALAAAGRPTSNSAGGSAGSPVAPAETPTPAHVGGPATSAPASSLSSNSTDDNKHEMKEETEVTEDMEQEEDVVTNVVAAVARNELLVYCSQTDLYLLRLVPPDNIETVDVLRAAAAPTLTPYRFLDRLLFLEYIPELSLIIAASSAGDQIILVRIVRYT